MNGFHQRAIEDDTRIGGKGNNFRARDGTGGKIIYLIDIKYFIEIPTVFLVTI